MMKKRKHSISTLSGNLFWILLAVALIAIYSSAPFWAMVIIVGMNATAILIHSTSVLQQWAIWYDNPSTEDEKPEIVFVQEYDMDGPDYRFIDSLIG